MNQITLPSRLNSSHCGLKLNTLPLDYSMLTTMLKLYEWAWMKHVLLWNLNIYNSRAGDEPAISDFSGWLLNPLHQSPHLRSNTEALYIGLNVSWSLESSTDSYVVDNGYNLLHKSKQPHMVYLNSRCYHCWSLTFITHVENSNWLIKK